MGQTGDSSPPASVNSEIGVLTAGKTPQTQNDKTPLLQAKLLRSLSGVDETLKSSSRTLTTFSGVFCPVVLSMFSVLLFLRIGFVVGQAGILESGLLFVLSYCILGLTILSICAISTNGAIEGGGCYFMISRALGPEFGGSIGTLFFFANIFSSALYTTGCVEGLVDNFGPGGYSGENAGLPVGRWWSFLYGSVIALLNCIICLIGARLFARMSVGILVIVGISAASVIISIFVNNEDIEVAIPRSNLLVYYNETVAEYGPTINGTYTGLSSESLQSNLWSNYTKDYTTMKQLDFATVFAVLFSGVTGIMAGANMSGDLKDPSKSIPRGTISAAIFTFLTYNIMSLLVAASSENFLLKNNYVFLQSVNVWPPFVTIGIFAATLSAALSNLIGASRILEALARDNLFASINLWPPFVTIGTIVATYFASLIKMMGSCKVLQPLAQDDLYGILLRPASKQTSSGNPWVAVLVAYFLVQNFQEKDLSDSCEVQMSSVVLNCIVPEFLKCVLLIGSLNEIAEMTSIFFLFSYACTNLACLALELASAPNFRPTFQFFSWHSALLGFISTLVMMFLINFIYAAISIILFILLFMVLHYRAPMESWGSISQALMFHQVRKYLLLLDSRKDHVKFWRPNMLLMVANPRSCCELIHFVNDLKKGGLYVLGHVKVGNYEVVTEGDPCLDDMPYWLALIDHLRVKAFVELTMANSVRDGLWQLIRISGLGAMKPNTIILGFYDSAPPQDSFTKNQIFHSLKNANMELVEIHNKFASRVAEDRQLPPLQYILLLQDCIKMSKNVCIARNFNLLDKEKIIKSKEPYNIDAWPLNFMAPETRTHYDTTCLFLLQLSCILKMTSNWKKHTVLRVFLCVDPSVDDTLQMHFRLDQLLAQLRINGSIHLCPIDTCLTYLTGGSHISEDSESFAATPETKHSPYNMPNDYLQAVNQVLVENMQNTAVSFLYFPIPPTDVTLHQRYLQQLQVLTEGLPPTLLVHGESLVTSTTL